MKRASAKRRGTTAKHLKLSPLDPGVAISVLCLCIETLDLFSTQPELKLQWVCSATKGLYLQHLRRTALALANSYRSEKLTWEQFSAERSVAVQNSVAFTDRKFENVAVNLIRRSQGSKTLFFSELTSIKNELNLQGILTAKSRRQEWIRISNFRECRSKLQDQLLQCARTNDVVAWARLLQIVRSGQPHSSQEHSLGQDHFKMIYALLQSDSVLLLQDYLNTVIGYSGGYFILSGCPWDIECEPLARFPSQVMSYFLTMEQQREFHSIDKPSILGSWLSVTNSLHHGTKRSIVTKHGFFKQIIWPLVCTLEEYELAIQLYRLQLQDPNLRPYEPGIGAALYDLFLDFAKRILDLETWKAILVQKELFASLYADDLLLELQKQLDPERPEHLAFVRWYLAQPWDIEVEIMPFRWVRALIPEKNATETREAFRNHAKNAANEDRTGSFAKQLKRIYVSDLLEFCDDLKYLLYIFCYQVKHETCSHDEFQDLRAVIRQNVRSDKWAQAFDFCLSLKKIRPQVVAELVGYCEMKN